MKRTIDGFRVGTDAFTRLNSISVCLTSLGFHDAIASPEAGVNQVLAKLHETEEALEELGRRNTSLTVERDIFKQSLGNEKNRRDNAEHQIRNLKAENEELQRRSRNQFETIQSFQSLTGLSKPERRSWLKDRRSNPSIYPYGNPVKAIRRDQFPEGMGVGAWRDCAEGEDGSTTLGTPGNDRRK